MKLSVIIVNFNVAYFLEQALWSVRKSAIGITHQVIVVDNHSVDRSIQMVREKFPEVTLIANEKNVGFSKANNQAIQMASGEYILLLNPDTVVEEDTFKKCIRFMDEHSEAGALGVKMMDGTGRFLPESKRGLPTPFVAFCKIFGLSALFPNSAFFGKYHLGFLDREQTHSVDILSGAFMLLRKSALDKTGLLDEQFFMYGEDIDLSWRLIKAGYKNYYFPEARIIHYKGESTKKTSVNYVFVFYRAMALFAKKHFSTTYAKWFSLLVNVAIFVRAGVALLSRFLIAAWLPLVDAGLIFSGMFLIKNYWETSVKAGEGLHYPTVYMTLIVPVYILVWMGSVFFSGGYDKQTSLFRLVRGIFGGSVFILVVYALLPEAWRFSRAMIILGTFWAIVSMVSFRVLLTILRIPGFSIQPKSAKNIIIAGGKAEVLRVSGLLSSSGQKTQVMGYVSEESISGDAAFMGNIEMLPAICDVFKPDEIIFCSGSLGPAKIMDLMARIPANQTHFKIAPPESQFIIGSNSVNRPGDIFTIGLNPLSKPSNRRSKRLMDVLISVKLLVVWPLLMLAGIHPLRLINNAWSVLRGKKTWVGFSGPTENLPPLPKGVLHTADGRSVQPDLAACHRLDLMYARDYSILQDLEIVIRGLTKLDRENL